MTSTSINRPVEIESILQFDAEVIYTEGHAAVIRVCALL
jgi:hypothetical protein